MFVPLKSSPKSWLAFELNVAGRFGYAIGGGCGRNHAKGSRENKERFARSAAVVFGPG